jgi:ABC-2 type transport system ATP-binding protein
VADQRIETLSFGFKKRVGIAQAIVHQPKLLVLDEPIPGLDPAQIVEMRNLINDLRGSQTIVLSSHNLAEISQTCDRIMVIHEGQVVAQGKEEELLRSTSTPIRIHIQLSGDRQKAEQVFSSFDQIKDHQCVSKDDGSLEFRANASTDIRSPLAAALVHAGLALLSLHRQQDDLESVFLALTQKKEAVQ